MQLNKNFGKSSLLGSRKKDNRNEIYSTKCSPWLMKTVRGGWMIWKRFRIDRLPNTIRWSSGLSKSNRKLSNKESEIHLGSLLKIKSDFRHMSKSVRSFCWTRLRSLQAQDANLRNSEKRSIQGLPELWVTKWEQAVRLKSRLKEALQWLKKTEDRFKDRT